MTQQQTLILLGTGVLILFLVLSSRNQARGCSGCSQKATTYTNLEDWEIIRDPGSNRIINIKVHRDARTS